MCTLLVTFGLGVIVGVIVGFIGSAYASVLVEERKQGRGGWPPLVRPLPPPKPPPPPTGGE